MIILKPTSHSINLSPNTVEHPAILQAPHPEMLQQIQEIAQDKLRNLAISFIQGLIIGYTQEQLQNIKATTQNNAQV